MDGESAAQDDGQVANSTASHTIARTLVGMARTRLELLHVDLTEEQESLIAQLRLSVISIVAGMLAGFTTILAIAVVAPDSYRPAVLATMAVLLGALSLWSFRLRAQHRPRFSRPFSALLQQLSQDAEAVLGRLEEPPRENQ